MTDTTPLPARADTLLGICQAIGDDLGFDPDWLRVALAASLLWNARTVIVCYLLAGLVIAAIRWLVPARHGPAAAPMMPVAVPAVGQAPEPLPLAA